MRSDSDLHEPRTDAEQSETGDDLRVSYVSRRGMVRPDLPIGSPERAAFFGLLSKTFPEDWQKAKEALARANAIAKGDLYFIRAGDAVKIGRTTNIVQRLTNMQTNNHLEIDCVLLLKGQGAQEESWHKRFKQDRIRGEWFRWSPELEAAVLAAREVNRLNANAPKGVGHAQ